MTNKRLPIRLVRGRSRTNGTWSSRRNAGLERTGQLACFHRERGYHVATRRASQTRTECVHRTRARTYERIARRRRFSTDHHGPSRSVRAYEHTSTALQHRLSRSVRAYEHIARRRRSAPIVRASRRRRLKSTTRRPPRAHRTSSASSRREHAPHVNTAIESSAASTSWTRPSLRRSLPYEECELAGVECHVRARPLCRPAHGLGAGSLAICRSARGKCECVTLLRSHVHADSRWSGDECCTRIAQP